MQSPCVPSDPENIFLRLLRVDLSKPQNLLDAFAAYKIFVESAVDVQYCGHCLKCYFGSHFHVSGNEKSNPSNVIDPYNFNPLDQALNNNIKSTLNLHNCQSMADYIKLIKNDFMSGIALGKTIQGQFTLQSEKQIFNAMSHYTWFINQNNTKLAMSEGVLKKHLALDVLLGCYRCKKPGCDFMKRKLTEMLDHAGRCTHMRIPTRQLYAAMTRIQVY